MYRLLAITTKLYRAKAFLSFTIKGGINKDDPIIESFVEMNHTFNQDHVDQFARICGDDNPIHINPAFAATSMFKGTIVHGILVSSLFSTLFGHSIEGCIYVNQDLSFKSPVHVGKEVIVKATVQKVENHKRGYMVTCSTTCSLVESNTLAIFGVAKVLILKS